MFQLFFVSFFIISLVAGADIKLDLWTVNLDRHPFPSKTVVAGDTITFKLLGPHSLWIFPSRSCEDPNDRIQIGSPGEGIVNYTFTDGDVGKTLFFACDAGTHCKMGQYIEVAVNASHDPWNARYDVIFDTIPDADRSRYEGHTKMPTRSSSLLAVLVSTLLMLCYQ